MNIAREPRHIMRTAPMMVMHWTLRLNQRNVPVLRHHDKSLATLQMGVCPGIRPVCGFIGRPVHLYNGLRIHRIRYSSTTTNTESVTEDIKDFDQAFDRILSKAYKVDVMVQSLDRKKLRNEIEDLVDEGFPVSGMDVLCDFTEVFSNIPQLTKLMGTVYDLGYGQKAFINMLTNQPSLMKYTSHEFFEYYKNLNSLGIRSVDIVKITSQCPVVLTMDTNTLKGRIAELRVLFKTQDVYALMRKSPHVLYEDTKIITEKFAYVHHEMGIKQRQMMYSNLFNTSLEHLHTRHMFLARSGFFKKIVSDKQISGNPSLDQIINPSDENFVKHFGEFSLEEYEVFKKLLRREKIINEEEDSTNTATQDDD